GVGQIAALGGEANLGLTNSGAIGVDATANATGYDAAANALAGGGAAQIAAFIGDTANLSLVNNGTGTADGISVSAIAIGNAATGDSADGSAFALFGVAQVAALGPDEANISLDNNAGISVVAHGSGIADAAGTIAADEAHGLAIAGVGAAQVGLGVANLDLAMNNGTAGVIAVSAEADADADELANATAVALAG